MINQVIGVSWQHPLSNRELEVRGPQCENDMCVCVLNWNDRLRSFISLGFQSPSSLKGTILSHLKSSLLVDII